MRVTIPLKWNPVKGAAGYRVRWRIAKTKQAKGVVTITHGTTLVLVIDLPTKSLYDVGVWSFDVAGNESAMTTLTNVYVA